MILLFLGRIYADVKVFSLYLPSLTLYVSGQICKILNLSVFFRLHVSKWVGWCMGKMAEAVGEIRF